MPQTEYPTGPRPDPNYKSHEQRVAEGGAAMLSAMESYLRALGLDVSKVDPGVRQAARASIETALKLIIEAR